MCEAGAVSHDPHTLQLRTEGGGGIVRGEVHTTPLVTGTKYKPTDRGSNEISAESVVKKK